MKCQDLIFLLNVQRKSCHSLMEGGWELPVQGAGFQVSSIGPPKFEAAELCPFPFLSILAWGGAW